MAFASKKKILAFIIVLLVLAMFGLMVRNRSAIQSKAKSTEVLIDFPVTTVLAVKDNIE